MKKFKRQSQFKLWSHLGKDKNPPQMTVSHIYIGTHNICSFGFYIPNQFKSHAMNIWCCIKPSHQNDTRPFTEKKKLLQGDILNLLILQKTGSKSKLCQAAQHTTFLPGSFKPTTEAHSSLLLFHQRGPPRFNWVLMESKCLLLLQPRELDRLTHLPPKSALVFYWLCDELSLCAVSAMKPTGESDRWWELDQPARP